MEKSVTHYFTSKQLFTQTDHEILDQIYDMLAYLGCKSDILGVIGSWKNTLPDSDILLIIKAINEDLKTELLDRLSSNLG